MLIRLLALLMVVSLASHARGDEAGLEFFEKRVRPVLAARCYECHSGEVAEPKGGLRLDSLAAAIKGGDTGPAVVPGKLKESLLVDAINHGELYQMPPKSKLPAEEIAALTKWVEMGAPWPQEAVAATAGGAKSEFNLAQRKADHWCWRPLTDPPVPPISSRQSPVANPIDAFLLAKLAEKDLTFAPPAEPRALLRRIYFDLIGLPPTVPEVDQFLLDKDLEQVVDTLLDSPHFGERWGRHWLDLVRYAESRGHEFDPNIPNAFEYRDYVIRALNADVPYDQFVIEHVAGDLVKEPRLHPTEGWNESIVGTGFWFLGEWLHSPVDIRKDECDRMDNQLDVLSKTFLGLTVSCARCHDHKFDAISQADYYALAGYLQSSSYRLARFDAWPKDRAAVADLSAIQAKHAPLVAAAIVGTLRPRIEALAQRLADEADQLRSAELGVAEFDLRGAETIVDFAELPPQMWLVDGPAFGAGPVAPGALVLGGDAQPALQVAVYGAACRQAALADLALAAPSEGDQGRLAGWMRAGSTLKTPTWTLKSGQVHYLIEGAGQVYAAVDSHAMLNGPLHGELTKETGGNSDLPTRWITHDLSRYAGHRVHLEFSPKAGQDFRVLQVVEGAERPSAPANRPNALLAAGMPVEACRELVSSTLELLTADKLAADPQPRDRAALANWLLAQAAAGEPTEEVRAALTAYAAQRDKLLAGVQRQSRVCLAMWDGTAVDENLLIRGNPKTAGPAVPRRLLEAVRGVGVAPPPAGSGRLELAQQLVDPSNPFASRVMVNRVWHHLFGRGIVPSVDNFGVLGQEPTHPELLDHLASQFVRDGWSLKRLIRRIVLSEAYAQASQVREQESRGRSEEIDPQNLLFHRQNLRRLEGEAIRDAILAVSGRLDKTMHGPSVSVHLTPFMQGRGRPGESGPLDGAGRRSIYVAVRRNFLAPMMLAFDTPSPASTVGRRNVSNVPAQALILMNDPFVTEQARTWANKLLADPDVSPESRIARMYQEALSREPTPMEVSAALEFIAQQAGEYGISVDAAKDDQRIWTDLGHVLFNVKEFVFVE